MASLRFQESFQRRRRYGAVRRTTTGNPPRPVRRGRAGNGGGRTSLPTGAGHSPIFGELMLDIPQDDGEFERLPFEARPLDL